MLRKLTFQFYDANSKEEAKHVLKMLSTVSSAAIEEIALTDISADEGRDKGKIWDQLCLDEIDEIVDSHAQLQGLKKIVIAVNITLDPGSEDVPAKIQKAVKDLMPKAVERGIQLVIQRHHPA